MKPLYAMLVVAGTVWTTVWFHGWYWRREVVPAISDQESVTVLPMAPLSVEDRVPPSVAANRPCNTCPGRWGRTEPTASDNQPRVYAQKDPLELTVLGFLIDDPVAAGDTGQIEGLRLGITGRCTMVKSDGLLWPEQKWLLADSPFGEPRLNVENDVGDAAMAQAKRRASQIFALLRQGKVQREGIFDNLSVVSLTKDRAIFRWRDVLDRDLRAICKYTLDQRVLSLTVTEWHQGEQSGWRVIFEVDPESIPDVPVRPGPTAGSGKPAIQALR